MTKTLRVDLADLEGIPHASGPSGTSVTVTAEYTSPVILEADGKIILSPKSKTMGAAGRVDFDNIYASDSEEVREDHRGFAVRVKVAIREPDGGTRTWARTVKPLEHMAETIRLGRMPSAEGLPPQWVSVDEVIGAANAAAAEAEAAGTSAQASVTLAQQAQAAAQAAKDAAEAISVSASIQHVSGTVALPETQGLHEVYALDTATVAGVTLDAGDAAVFRLLGTQWSYMVVGQHTAWQQGERIPDAVDSFTAPDGSIVGRVTETGGLTWAKDSTNSPVTGTATSTGVTWVRSNHLAKGSGEILANSSVLTLPQTNAQISFDYTLATSPAATRIAAGVGGQEDGQRISAFFDSTQGIKMYRWNAAGTGSVTKLGPDVTGQPLAGRMALGYDGTNAFVMIDGVTVLSVATAAAGLGTRCGVALSNGNGQTIDNVEVQLL